MTSADSIQPQSTALKNAIRWISDTVQEKPEKTRDSVVREAALRFDLNPSECEFLNSNFVKLTHQSG